MPRVGFEPTISAGERPKTYALDRAATGTGSAHILVAVFVVQGQQFMYCPLVLKLQVKIYKFFTRAHFMLRSSVPSMICRR